MNHEFIIIYESIYNGNTEKIARTMARKLGCRFVQVQKALQEDLSRCKVIGFGSGIQNCSERAIHLHYSWRDAIKVA